jgi:hypothetical protein
MQKKHRVFCSFFSNVHQFTTASGQITTNPTSGFLLQNASKEGVATPFFLAIFAIFTRPIRRWAFSVTGLTLGGVQPPCSGKN